MEEQLLHKAILKQDAEVFEYLMDQYGKLLWIVVSGILKNVGTKEDIEECVSECFISLWEHPKKYDSARGSIKTYLCIMARSRAVDRVRKLNKVTFMPYDDSMEVNDTDMGDLLADKELVKKIFSYAKGLKAVESEIFILRYFYQLKPMEIAIKLNLSVKEVSNKLFYSKKCLINEFKGETL